MKRFHLVVAGNIGAGKTSFVERYAQRHRAVPVLETVEANPYLADFYADRARWAFHSQIFFLVARLRQAGTLAAENGVIVQDRSVYEDAEIFAENLFREGSLSARDHATYRSFYDGVRAAVRPPDLVLYLRASVPVLQRRIAQRARKFEAEIPADYLQRLNDLYDEFARQFKDSKVLTIEAGTLDFVQDQAAFAAIVRAIETA